MQFVEISVTQICPELGSTVATNPEHLPDLVYINGFFYAGDAGSIVRL